MNRRVSILASAVVALALLPACKRLKEKAEEKAIERATGGQVQLNGDNGGKVTVSAPDGGGTMTFGAGTEIPKDWPKDVPVYPGAKPLASLATTNDQGKPAWLMTLETTDSKEQVVAFYKGKMTSYTSTADMDMGQGHMTNYESGTGNLTLLVSQDKAGAKTTIQLTAGGK
jgi:hypothetical protein